ncbi:hypothetical protein [Streptomyces sp. NPDC002520]
MTPHVVAHFDLASSFDLACGQTPENITRQTPENITRRRYHPRPRDPADRREPGHPVGPVETRATKLDGIDDFVFPGHGRTVPAAPAHSGQVVLVRRDGSRTVVLTGKDRLSNAASVAVRGRSVHVPGAASVTRCDPNLLLARLRYPAGRL